MLHPWDEERLSNEMTDYQKWLDERCEQAYQIAESARAQGKDMTERVEIPRAADLAGRCEKLLEEYLEGISIADELRQLLLDEDRETASIEMAKQVASRMYMRSGDKVKSVEIGLRVGLAILTEAVLVAPLEGISNVRLLNNADGSQFVSVDFCGPIRAAGGTAQALAVLITDVVRRELEIGPYIARFGEVERVKEEFGLYRKNLQYRPSPEEVDIIVRACPVMINGESTEPEDCAGYGNLENIDGSRVRGGVLLVIGEGLCLKAPKVQRHTERLQVEGWDFISHFADKDKSKSDKESTRKSRLITANDRFMDDIIAGRPVFGEPSKAGGFRLRYGRTRATGLAAGAISPVTMVAMNSFLAVGTQMKIERPGKACAVTPCEELQGPTFLLNDGRFGRVDFLDKWPQVADDILAIWDNGELMLGYGEFMENNKRLIPAAYNRDWWVADLCATLGDESQVEEFANILSSPRSQLPDGAPATAVDVDLAVHSMRLRWVDFLSSLTLTWEAARKISATFNCAVPPPWNVPWADVPIQWLSPLSEALASALVQPAQESKTKGWNDDSSSPNWLRLVDAAKGWKPLSTTEEPPVMMPGVEVNIPDSISGKWRCGDHHLVHGVMKATCMLLGLEHHHDGNDLVLTKGWEGLVEGLGMAVADDSLKILVETAPHVTERLARVAHAHQVILDEDKRQEELQKNRSKVRIEAETAARQRGEGISDTERAGDEAANTIEDSGPVDEELLIDSYNLIDEHQVDGSLWIVRRCSDLRWEHAIPARIGARMARPEKAAHREMKTAVNALFPVSTQGGPQRLMLEAAKKGNLRVSVGTRECLKCGRPSPFIRCHHRHQPEIAEACNGRTKLQKSFGNGRRRGEFQTIPLLKVLEVKRTELNLDRIPKVKCVKGLSSKGKTPEPLEKGILRARHQLPVFRDGTVRFDMSDVPLTHFRPCEIGTSWQRLTELGYTTDVYGQPLSKDDQILELYPQDFVPSTKAINHLVKVCNYIDEMLERFYGMEKFYNVGDKDDLVGQLAIALAPHTSGGVLCRLIGFTEASGGYAHTLFHAAKRRNCDGDEDSIIMLLDGLLNFSKEVLPANRGGRMDAPLVLTTRLNPSELDKEALNVDSCWFYERSFYEATLEQPHPKDLSEMMDYVERRLGSIGAVRGYGFTRDLLNLDSGPENSSYKLLETMVDKMNGQIELAEKLRAVNVQRVATAVVDSHFFPDLRGNLMAFTRQKVRCGRCGHKYRRLPLAGVCIQPTKTATGAASIIRADETNQCNGNLIMTVAEGSIRKYVKTAQHVMDTFGTTDYSKQKYNWLAESLDSLFKNDRVKIYTLDEFV